MTCAGCAGFVQGKFTPVHKIFPFTIIHLRSSVQDVQAVQGISKFIYRLLQNTVLFLKKNFNLKLPCTACTDCSSPVVS